LTTIQAAEIKKWVIWFRQARPSRGLYGGVQYPWPPPEVKRWAVRFGAHSAQGTDQENRCRSGDVNLANCSPRSDSIALESQWNAASPSLCPHTNNSRAI